MRITVISNTEVPLLFFDPATMDDPCLFVSDDRRLARKARRRGFRTATGDLRDAAAEATPHE